MVVMRLLGLTDFASMALSLVRIHSHCLQFWLKGKYRAPGNLFKPLRFAQEALFRLCSFVPQVKLIHQTPLKAIVTTDASMEVYRGYMNNLSFKGQKPGRKVRETHINLLELETIWKACQQFRQEIKGKLISFKMHNMTEVSYLWKEGQTHCRKLNGLAGKNCSDAMRMK